MKRLLTLVHTLSVEILNHAMKSEIKACFVVFSLYHPVLKGKQGVEQNCVHIGAYYGV